jgi:hypothetical protein
MERKREAIDACETFITTGRLSVRGMPGDMFKDEGWNEGPVIR